jgi:hypothetical protein
MIPTETSDRVGIKYLTSNQHCKELIMTIVDTEIPGYVTGT